MKYTFEHSNKEFIFDRYPKTDQRSLKAWNAADELILEHFENYRSGSENVVICNDRFGFLASNLHWFSTNVVINFASQKKAILRNLVRNNLSSENIKFVEPFQDSTRNVDFVLLKIPKSMDLFRMQLIQIAKSLDENGVVLCGFMTKSFTKQMLEIASEFFESVEQSLAKKKSRVLILKGLKSTKKQSVVNSITFENQIYKQYFGVFSAKNIDIASQFFVGNWKIENDLNKVLDLASGNGFLAKMIRLRNADCEIHLLDDDWLAVESSKLNFDEDDEDTFFHFSDSLSGFENEFFDLILCNPPFHFEHETNIEVAIGLFAQAKRCLSKQGSFQLVANRHLNYRTHLSKLFEKVELLRRNKKFEIYECSS